MSVLEWIIVVVLRNPASFSSKNIITDFKPQVTSRLRKVTWQFYSEPVRTQSLQASWSAVGHFYILCILAPTEMSLFILHS